MIYLDHAATTPPYTEVIDEMSRVMKECYGNASSEDHDLGKQACKIIQQARIQIAQLVGGSPRHVIFTSGATESINLALRGFVAEQNETIKILTTPIEHPAVLDTLRDLENKKLCEITFCKINNQGLPELENIDTLLKNKYDLCVMMAANNETGAVFPVEKISKICQSHNTPFLCDACQAAGKTTLDMNNWGVSALALSAHKMYGPLGIGALVLSDDFLVQPILSGGGQQKGLRPGTLNTPAIAGFSVAAKIRMQKMNDESDRLTTLRSLLIDNLMQEIPNLQINTPGIHKNIKSTTTGSKTKVASVPSSLPGHLHISVPGSYNKIVVAQLGRQLAISSSSACSSGSEKPSHVLTAMELDDTSLRGSFRFSLGATTTKSDIEQAARLFIKAVADT